MANRVGTKLRAIAQTAIQETLRRKVFYLVVILVVFLVVIFASEEVTVQMATDAGERAIISDIHSGFIKETFGMWTFASMFLALYLGSIALASEVSGKTLVNVLSRPVEHAVYLTGRWLGILAFLLAFESIGLIFGVGAAKYLGVPFSATIWFGCLENLVSVTFFSGVSLGLSVVAPPILAGAFALILTAIPSFASDGLHHPKWVLRTLAQVGYYIAPAQMPGDLISDSFSKGQLHPPYLLYSQVLLENTLYAVMVFAIGCAIFARREARLR